MLQLASGEDQLQPAVQQGPYPDKGDVLGTDTKSNEKKRDAPDTLQSGLMQSSPGDVQSAGVSTQVLFRLINSKPTDESTVF